MTEEKKPDLISPWMPESNALIHQALGKAAEEAAELAGSLIRCMIQGLDEKEPVTGKPNQAALEDEIADLIATLRWLRDVADVNHSRERVERKLEGYKRWEQLIRKRTDPAAYGYTEGSEGEPI